MMRLVVGQLHGSHIVPYVLLYIGPDVFLPITSAFAAIAGVVLMFWHRLFGWGRKLFAMIFRKKG